MSLFLSTLASALGGLIFGALVMTFVLAILLALGGGVVVAYLLVPSIRTRLDGWMDQQEGDIWADTLASVDAQTEMYRRQHRTYPQRRMDGAVEREPALTPAEPVQVNPRTHDQPLHEFAR